MSDGLFHEGLGFVFGHALLELVIHEPPYVGTPTSAESEGHLHHGTAQGDVVNTATVNDIPSTDNDPGHEIVLVLIYHPPHEMGGRLDGRGPTGFDGQLAQIMADVVRKGLGVGGTAGAADPDPIVDLGDLVGDADGDVGARRCPGVGSHDDSAVERYGHDGGTGGMLPWLEVVGVGRRGRRSMRSGCVHASVGAHFRCFGVGGVRLCVQIQGYTATRYV
mmetsp:Transcript_18634/g.53566  ORF Transcript_18634/g.53566 Transcript_18634/m.53566 type:complete len:220 (+) Transcript_18634:205-864(+)